MKSAGLVAVALWLGVASADVHKLKLKKIPLSEQLVCFDYEDPGADDDRLTLVCVRKAKHKDLGPCARAEAEVHGHPTPGPRRGDVP